MKYLYLILVFFGFSAARAQLYKHDFGTTPIIAPSHPYTVPPSIVHSQITGSSWTNSTGSWVSFVGSSGEAIALQNSSGSPVITLTFNIGSGYKANITSFDFWRQRSTTGAPNWSMTINGIPVGSGTSPTSGAYIGTTNVSNAITNLSGMVTVVITLSGASGSGTFRLDDFTLNGTVLPDAYTLLDHFNRNDSIYAGVPSSGPPEYWLEIQEPYLCFSTWRETVRIKNNMLELSSCTLSNGSCGVNTIKTASIEMTAKYSTVFANASNTMEWYFNMQQSRTDPDGFGSGLHGAGFVIGAISREPLDADKRGYAVVFGEAGTTDPIRLVSFNGGFSAANFTNILSVPSPAVKTNYMSVRVTFNPCNSEWSLLVRDDGPTAFSDPTTISGTPVTAVNNVHTSLNLLWLGTVWSHTTTCTVARFDNIYIPIASAAAGSYTWDGSAGTDFQDPYNWTPVRQCARVTDRLVFNASSPATSAITNMPDQTIGQLLITNNRTVTINDVTDAAVNTLSIAGAAGTDLQIDNGSSLILSVTSAGAGGVVINVNSGATGSISGSVLFNSPFTPKAHKLLAGDASGIIVNNGGIIRANNLSGNPFGNTVPQNTIVFNAGSAYEYLSGANPFGLAQPQSKVVFNSGSTYRHISTNAPSLSGRVYADFLLLDNIIVSGGAAPFQADNLRISTGSFTINGATALNTVIKKNLDIDAAGSLIYNTTVPSLITFSGNAAQFIYNDGILDLNHNLTVRLNSTFATAPQLTVENDITIKGVLDIVQGTIRLNGNIELHSDATATASVAPVTGDITYGAGRFIVERYIPLHPKAWQFIAAPASGQTIKEAWQEGAATPLANPVSGFGTIITGHQPDAVTARGFDIYTPNGPSLKTYDTSNTWIGTDNTFLPVYNPSGYMLMVRGDRSVTTYNAPATPTTLRTKGMIHAPSNPPPVITVHPGKFASIGNPYPSAIDFSSVSRTGDVQDIFYVWDPKLTTGTAWGLGGYQTFTGSGGTYVVTPGGGSYAGTNRMIESGMAFLVRSPLTGGTVGFSESNKVSGSNLVTRGGGGAVSGLRTNLYVIHAGGEELLDGTLAEFDPAYSADQDEQDAVKMQNTGEGLGIRSVDMLVVERRPQISIKDTFRYSLSGLRRQAYQLRFLPEGIGSALQGYLIDNYLGSRTPVSLEEPTTVNFSVTTDPASSAAGRFLLVFDNRTPVITHVPGIQIAPNPVEGHSIKVRFSNMPRGSYAFRVINTTGQVLRSGRYNHSGGEGIHSVSIPSLVSGTYHMEYLLPDNNRKGFTFLKR